METIPQVNEFLPQLFSLLGDILILVLGTVVSMAAWWVKKQKQNETLIGDAVEIVFGSVERVNKEFANELKAKNKDGKLPAKEAMEAFNLAEKYVYAEAETLGKNILKFIQSKGSLWLERQIESAVREVSVEEKQKEIIKKEAKRID